MQIANLDRVEKLVEDSTKVVRCMFVEGVDKRQHKGMITENIKKTEKETKGGINPNTIGSISGRPPALSSSSFVLGRFQINPVRVDTNT